MVCSCLERILTALSGFTFGISGKSREVHAGRERKAGAADDPVPDLRCFPWEKNMKDPDSQRAMEVMHNIQWCSNTRP